ncbi:MAG: AMP-binding protein, partial [bacterium]
MNVGGLVLETFPVEIRGAVYDLVALLHETEDDVAISWEYKTGLFERATVEQFAARFHRMLEAIVDGRERRISELPFVTRTERGSLLAASAAQPAREPVEAPVDELFERAVDRSPDAIAVVEADVHTSFAELDCRANRLAHSLRQAGIARGDVVGLALRRSTDLIVAVLGVVKAGAAYLPLDPEYPSDRLRFMLEDSAAVAVVVDLATRDRFDAVGVPLFVAAADALSTQPTTRPMRIHGSRDLAYAIYTSGSTGHPKGVLVEHGGLVTYLRWAVREYRVAEGGGAPLHSSLSFDLTVTTVFAPLLAGRPITIVPEGEGVDALAATLRSGSTFSFVKV